ncbi:MAG: 2-C-methyl-D-erythritol 2,4-cyclodiphosphate synthase [Dehalococcoidales bacterium]|nr:2-C-methyl-D-erythritol 2,4-cyclodiphosphate synthase [Dehalococcoidales bacterium]
MTGDIRVGIGYDIHPFVSGRKLVLGGVEIVSPKGLGGWSDADVLTHAVIDALLGAANLGDIGRHFPAGKAEFRDVSSVSLLSRVNEMLKVRGWEIGNIDANVIAEQPKLSENIEKMQLKLAEAVAVDVDRISIKAKTGNGLGTIGKGEGIAAQAVALIYRTHRKNERRKL